jgi:hypothetical protein
MKLKILSVIFFLSSIQANYIIFENIGQMAPAVTYIHTKVTIKTTEIENMMISYRINIEYLYKTFSDIQKDPTHGTYGETQALAKQGADLIYTFMLDYQLIRDDFYLIRWLLPAEPERPQRFLEVLGIGLGVMGTFFGIYNTAQIAQVKTGISNVKLTQDHIVHAIVDMEQEQKKIKNAVNALDTMMTQWRTLNPAMYAVKAARMEKLVRRLVTKLSNTFQMALAHRLSIDFFDVNQLQALYEKVRKMAEKKHLMLLTEKPTDLFQLEVSYFSNGTDLHLIIHVPAVNKQSLLQLYKMHPLPLPINRNQVLIPHVRDNVLGLSQGSNKLSVHLSSTDLLDCKVINKIFLCERHAVLHKQINSSCMGALYLQNFESAAHLCPLQIKPIQEIVHQLANNWFLIFTPKPLTAAISCLNGTESQFYLPEGISKRHLSAGCKVEFANHVLMSDSSITLENTIQHFDWTWMKDLSEIDNITAHLQQMHDFGFKDPTMKEINDFHTHGIEGAQYKWHLATIIISISLAVIFVIIFCICCTNKVVLKRILANILFSKPKPSKNDEVEMKVLDFLCKDKEEN